jgi:iron(III) transport system substrate-binding protein
MPTDAIPTTRAQLIEILNSRREAFAGKVCTFDPEKSGTGFMWSSAELRGTSTFWDFARALGAVRAQLYSSSGQMREKIVSGEHWLAINMFNSYAEEWARRSSNIGVVWQTDFTPAISRVAIVPRQAPRPNAGRLFLDFLLSTRGQAAIARGGLASIRTDVTDGANITSINRNANGNLRPIEMTDTLLEFLDPGRRSTFLGEWKRLLQG